MYTSILLPVFCFHCCILSARVLSSPVLISTAELKSYLSASSTGAGPVRDVKEAVHFLPLKVRSRWPITSLSAFDDVSSFCA